MVTTEKITTTKEEREALVEKAVALFNLAFDEYGIEESLNLHCRKHEHYDGDLRNLTCDDIKLTQVTTKAGHLGIHESGEYWKLGLNLDAWQKYYTPERKTSILLHELAHMPVENTGHKPQFWETYARGIQTALNNHSELTDIMGMELRPDTLRDYAAQTISVASDVDDTTAQTETFCDMIDYQERLVKSFSDVFVVFSDSSRDRADAEIPLSDIHVPDSYRDWRLHQVLNRQSPVGFFIGDRVQFNTPIIVESLPEDEQPVAKHRSGANAALLKRVEKLNAQELTDIPVRVR